MGRATAFAGAGAWMLALGLGLGSAAWPEYVKPHPYAVLSLLVIGSVMLLAPFVQRFVPIFRDASPEQFHIGLSIEGIVRTRTGGPMGRWQYADIFVQASAHLKNPPSIKVEYVADLIKHGVCVRARSVDDISAWHIAERKEYELGRKGEYRDVYPLTTSLSRREKVDGWLHFQVDLDDLEVTNSCLRLTARGPRDAVVVERQLAGSFPGRLMIQRKSA